MEEKKSILHELYVFSEWKPEQEYLQKPDNILPENISALWRWIKFFGPKKSLIDSVTAFKQRHQKWHTALGEEGKVIAVLTDNILEIRTKRSEYATIAARTTVSRDGYPQWRRLAWSPDCSFLALAYGNGIVSFFDLTASSLFNIPADCIRPGGLECSDNTHAVADIIFKSLRVKDNKWNWEVLIVTFDGKLRCYLVSQSECTLHHSFRFTEGVSAVAYNHFHCALYVAGLPTSKDPSSSASAGVTSWRIVNDEPWYLPSVATQEAPDSLARYVPFGTKNLTFVVRMVLSSDHNKLVCLHCNGDVSVWRLPALKLLYRWSLASQPQCDVQNPLVNVHDKGKDLIAYQPADVNWWTNEELILSRFSGAVTVCDIQDMINILGNKPEFFQGAPQVTRAHEGTFMVLECESTVLPAKRSRSDDSMEIVEADPDTQDSMLEVAKELVKSVLYGLTDIEAFQPKPKRITVVSRIYRLLGVKSTTPSELFSRKIESGQYEAALSLAATFGLDQDLVYQQQWRRNPVSTDAIHKYLSKVSAKIWVVHQCVDRLPETLTAARELLSFGLQLTSDRILDEINKDLPESEHKTVDDITLEDLNSSTSELLRCRHVMLFYTERLKLYESILKCEKSSYVKDEYHRLRSNSVVHSAVEIAKEGRIHALTCLWPHINTVAMQLSVLEKIPETISPMEYKGLLPRAQPDDQGALVSPVDPKPSECAMDWCRKDIFRSIWNSNWSEDTTPEKETSTDMPENDPALLTRWYEMRAREIEERSGLVSNAMTLLKIASSECDIPRLETIMDHVKTLDVLVYDINVEGITLRQVENMNRLDTCKLLVKNSTSETYVSDLKEYVLPYLSRNEARAGVPGACSDGLVEFLESVSVDDLSTLFLILNSKREFELDVRTHLQLAERCILAYSGTGQLDLACDLLGTVLRETDGSISNSELVHRIDELERLVSASSRMSWRGVSIPPKELKEVYRDHRHARNLLTRVARSLATSDIKPTQQEWEKVLSDLMSLQSTLFTDISEQECFEIYASAQLTSGDASSIRLAADVLTVESSGGRSNQNSHNLVPYKTSIELVKSAAKEYFNSASSLADPALELARSCLLIIRDDNKEIRQELDLIAALQLLHGFGLTVLPIQVRLCEDRLSLVEQCLSSQEAAYLATPKLLKLAKLLRVAGDDEQLREGQVLQLIGSYALRAGPAGYSAAADAARRLVVLRYAPAATLMADVAKQAKNVESDARKQLYAAAVTYCDGGDIENMLRARLGIEVECLERMSGALREHQLLERADGDDDFADAVTTPIIEKKDLVAPSHGEKVPLLTYLLGTLQNKLGTSDKSAQPEPTDRSVHLQEFYSSLYQQHRVSQYHYRYDTFSLPGYVTDHSTRGLAALKWFYVQSCLDDSASDMETEVVTKCAEEILYRDTPLSVSCLLVTSRDVIETKRLIETHNTDTAVCAALYSTLMRCNRRDLKDSVYLTTPSKMAKKTLKQKTASEEQMAIIRQCLDKLSGMGQVDQLRAAGFAVNSLLFNADEDYRRETIYRVARSPETQHLQLALSLATKHGVDPLDTWLQHASHLPSLSHLPTDTLPDVPPDGYNRIKDALWPSVRGSDHNALIALLTLLKSIDDKPLIAGLSAAEHIKLLKKAKAASSDLDYKLLLEQPSLEQFSEHILQILKPETVGMLTKFLRSLPPAFKVPMSVNAIYTAWLTDYFFSVPPAVATTKKWMQQYRQCASYFNKLTKEDLLTFLTNTCFSHDAIQRVPWGTRSLMLMQAVDYCQQEQENDFKLTKHEQSWSQVGQELTRWSRFLENYHSTTIQAIVDTSHVPRDQIWIDIEASHGDGFAVVSSCAQLVLREIKPSALTTLLQCLNVDATPNAVLLYVACNCVDDAQTMETLVSRVTQYHKEGIKLSDELIDVVMQKATQYHLPPHKQISLLSLSNRAQVQDSGDLRKVAQFTIDLFRSEWQDEDFVNQLTEEALLSEDGRREVFSRAMQRSDSWQRKKALCDVLGCWPPNGDGHVSVHCEYLQHILRSSDQQEALVLIKLLLRKPVLSEKEVTLLTEAAPSEAVVNAIWITLLSKCDNSQEIILKLIASNKDCLEKQQMDAELIKQLLDSEMFLKLVSTPLYASIIDYVVSQDVSGSETSQYTVAWATEQLIKANLLAEAGHLHLLSIGVPASLRGFSQSLLYVKNMLMK